jgi:hypothetical protein
MEFLFADDPFVDLMNIFPFRFTEILFPSFWVLSAFSWYTSIRLLSCQERSAVLAWMVLLSALRLCSVICTSSGRCLSYVEISFRIGCYIDFCISVLCHVFRSCSTCVSRDMNAVCSPNILLILESFLTLSKGHSHDAVRGVVINTVLIFFSAEIFITILLISIMIHLIFQGQNLTN